MKLRTQRHPVPHKHRSAHVACSLRRFIHWLHSREIETAAANTKSFYFTNIAPMLDVPGGVRIYQVPFGELVSITSLSFGVLVAADTMPSVPEAVGPAVRRIAIPADVVPT